MPDGPFTIEVAGGPPGGAALLFIAATGTSPETLVDVGFTSYFLRPRRRPRSPRSCRRRSTARGSLTIDETNGPIAGTGVLQAAVLDAQGFGRGTTNPLTVTLQ